MLDGLQDGSIEDNLLYVDVKAGQSYRIEPGLIHGAVGNLEILEISQSAALDFCIYPWGAALGTDEFDDALTIIDALDFIEYRHKKPMLCKSKRINEQIDELVSLKQFVVNKIHLNEALRISSEKVDTYSVYYCLYGKARIKTEIDGLEMVYPLEKGCTVLVPAEVDEIILEPLEQTTSIIEALGGCDIKKEENERGE